MNRTDTPAIAQSTLLSPDAAALRATMRRLAEAESDDVPILTAYVDVRPQAHGERPAARAELVALRHRLDDIVGRHAAHSPSRQSLDADRQRLEQLLEDERLTDAEGVAIFAASGLGLWEAIRAQQPFETDVDAGRIADLYPLARLATEDAGAVVALVDTNTCRLLTWRRGALVERPGPDEAPDEHRRHDQGGWSQARYQRHVDEQDRRFAQRAAQAITVLVEAEHAVAVVVGAEERTSSVLLPQLPDSIRALLADVRHISMRASRDEVEEEVGPLLATLFEERAREAAERATAGHGAGSLGILGATGVSASLDAGAVSELVFDAETASAMERWERADLVRRALLTDADVVVALAARSLADHGGVGAKLRFRPPNLSV